MTRWEYKNVALGFHEQLSDVLRRYGEQGWEAWHFFVVADPPSIVTHGYREVFFKRPIQVPT